MKEKILWIIAAIIFGIAYILLNIFPPTVYHTSQYTWWLINIGVMLIFIGLPIFPLTAFIALLLPRKLSYPQRFKKVLPFFVILLGLLLILGTLANAW